MDLQVLNNIYSDSKKLEAGEKPHFGTVTGISNGGKSCKLVIDGDTEALNINYMCINSVNIGNRVLLYYAGAQIIVIGAVN